MPKKHRMHAPLTSNLCMTLTTVLRETMARVRPTLYGHITHRAKSGMSRSVRIYAVHDNELYNMTPLAVALGYTRSRSDEQAVTVNGCGFNAADDVADELLKALCLSADDKGNPKLDWDKKVALKRVLHVEGI